MELWSLDSNFNTNAVIDSFESLIWNVRYNDYGDFELYTRPSKELIDLFQNDTFVWLSDEPSRPMIIETMKIETDSEDGNHLTVTGHSLESMLDWRVIWLDSVLKGNFQNEVKRLLDDAIINPSDDARKIEGFMFVESSDPRITELTIDTKVSAGDKLGETINKLCQEKDIGWKVYLDDSNNFVFELFAGTDRSYDQDINPYVVFSKGFDNLISSEYNLTKVNATVTLVVGERDKYVEEHSGQEYDTETVDITGATGFFRREVKTDCTNVSSKNEDDTQMWWEDYHEILKSKGRENVAEIIKNAETIDAEVDHQGMFRYGRDFTLGDILPVINEYGIEAKVRVTEMIRSQDASGISMYPKFTVMED